MPQYDFRCKTCRLRFTISFRTYAEYEVAVPKCPECESLELSRLISQVVVRKPSRDYGRMSSGEMLSVLESGDQNQVSEMFKQVGGQSDATQEKSSKS